MSPNIEAMTASEISEHTQMIFQQWHSGQVPFWEAFNQLEALLQRAQALGDRTAEAFVCLTIGKAQIERSNLDEASEHLQKAINIFQSNAAYDHLAEPYLYLGNISYAQGRLVKAQGHYRDALRLAMNAKNQHFIVAANSKLGIVLFDLEQYTQAETALQNALQDAEKLAEKTAMDYLVSAETLTYLARLHLREHRLNEAWQCSEQAFVASEQANSQLIKGVIQRIQGQIATHPDFAREQQADALFEASQQTLRAVKAHAEMGNTLMAQAEYYLKQTKFRDAAETYHRAMQIFLKCGMASKAGVASELERDAREKYRGTLWTGFSE